MEKILRIILLLFLITPSIANSQIDSGYVEVKKGEIFYRVWGEGYPIVFINGGPGMSSDGYNSYAENLSQFGKIILFDQRGTGRSESKIGLKTGVYNIWDMVEDLEALRIHLKIDKWTVFGHSFGGQYALYYISKYSNNVNKLILSATPEYGEIKNYDRQRFKRASIEDLEPMERLIQNKLDSLLKDPTSDNYLIYRLEKSLLARNYVYNRENYDKVALWFLEFTRTHYHKIEGKENDKKKLTKRLQLVETPTLIIHGLSDFLNFENPSRNHSVLKNSHIEMIENCGHVMLLDQPQIYLEKIGQFLNKKNFD